jgi:hypothetical protein
MPPFARNVVDTNYISVLTRWIESLPSDYTLPGGVFVTQIPTGFGNDSDYELGMKFRASQPGIVTAIRYYRTAEETGAHIGRLWTGRGNLLATATFTGESSSGWQIAPLPNPLILAANTIYVVSVNSNASYAYSDQGLATTITNGALSTVADGVNGVFNDTPALFPTSTYHNANYFRDVFFTPFTAFEQWKVANGFPYDAAPVGDTDGDGWNLLFEYALGSNPAVPSNAAAPILDGSTYIFYRARPDVTYIIETSEDLNTWTPISTNPGTVGQLVHFAVPDTFPRLFIRLRVQMP